VQPDPIVTIEAVEARVPLSQTLELGAMVIAERGYAAVAVTTASGRVGRAISLTRDMPVAAVVNGPLARALRGTDALLTGAAWDAMYRATIAGGRTGVAMRAISLVEIALWDVKGQAAGLPVWALLGGQRRETDVMMVGGYAREGVPAQELGERVAAYAAAGYRRVKIARAPDPDVTAAVVRAAAERLPPGAELVVDGAWAFRDAAHLRRETAAWGDAPLAWLEDPMPPENTAACIRLGQGRTLPFAYGDDVTDEHALRRLVEAGALDVLRVDATTVGGLAVAARLTALATSLGIPVSYHVYPELHVHLALGLPGSLSIESFDPADNPFDPCSQLLTGGPQIAAGVGRPSEAPGLGFGFDEEQLARYAV
jgi:L-alanine-DL-glutamate epimerase-like enolase superfamily enzyme